MVTSSSAAVGCTRHGGVEIGFLRAQLDRDGQQLRHFAGVVAEDMHAEHAVGLAVDDDLHDRTFSPRPDSVAFSGRKLAT